MPEGHSADSIPIDEFRTRLSYLLRKVTIEKARVEVDDGEHCAVLISKEELDSLEEALELLANTTNVEQIARTIAAMASTVANGPLIGGRSRITRN